MQYRGSLVLLLSLLLPSLWALKLHPGGALVPEETAEVQEARDLHEAAYEAAMEGYYTGDQERQYAGCRCMVGRPLSPACRTICSTPGPRDLYETAHEAAAEDSQLEADDQERQYGPPCFSFACRRNFFCRRRCRFG